SDGKIILAGASSIDASQDTDASLLRLTSGGTLDTTFGTASSGKRHFSFGSLQDAINDVAVQNDGKIVVAGSAKLNGALDFVVARLSGAGDLDNSFGSGGVK